MEHPTKLVQEPGNQQLADRGSLQSLHERQVAEDAPRSHLQKGMAVRLDLERFHMIICTTLMDGMRECLYRPMHVHQHHLSLRLRVVVLPVRKSTRSSSPWTHNYFPPIAQRERFLTVTI